MTKVSIPEKAIKFTVEALPEDIPIEGNASASDPKTDLEVEARIKEELAAGNIWAWCCVKITGEYEGRKKESYLGGCSYRNEEDFTSGNYYPSMCAEIVEAFSREESEKISQAMAREACNMLVAAYEANEDGCGTIDWSDVDVAYNLARQAVGGWEE